jgi:hypothetical protein
MIRAISLIGNPAVRLSIAPCLVLALAANPAAAQFDDDQLGGWYTYQWTLNRSGSTLGWQGDLQLRYWDVGGDTEQRLLRSGLTWQPGRIKYTLGVAHVVSEAFGPSSADSEERRLYQEALWPAQRIGEHGFLVHRIRTEERYLEGQDLRTRLRYLVGYNHVLNQTTLTQGALYLAFSNELFVNLERGIGGGRQVDYFDRNRFAAGLGYSLTDGLRIQLSYMRQSLDSNRKDQLQLNVIHTF